jgi:hypothetical protein
MTVELVFPTQTQNFLLGDVFQYILSDEWGKALETPIDGEILINANTCDNVHYEKPKTGEDEGENDCNKPRQS